MKKGVKVLILMIIFSLLIGSIIVYSKYKEDKELKNYFGNYSDEYEQVEEDLDTDEESIATNTDDIDINSENMDTNAESIDTNEENIDKVDD